MNVTNDNQEQQVVLEPACGTGNFLVEILNRKMEAVRKQFSRNRYEYDLASAQAVSSMYGVELLPDNVETCQNRLMAQYLETYHQHLSLDASPELERCIRFLLKIKPTGIPSPFANGRSSVLAAR